ncbi:unnamed protein product [Discosporangium mesarthrocarpum]
MFSKVFSAFVALVVLVTCANAFMTTPVVSRAARTSSALRMADVAFPGGKKTTANSGESLKGVAKKARYNAAYGCEEGKCGTCEHKVNGKKVRLCIGKLPAGAGPFKFTQ